MGVRTRRRAQELAAFPIWLTCGRDDRWRGVRARADAQAIGDFVGDVGAGLGRIVAEAGRGFAPVDIGADGGLGAGAEPAAEGGLPAVDAPECVGVGEEAPPTRQVDAAVVAVEADFGDGGVVGDAEAEAFGFVARRQANAAGQIDVGAFADGFVERVGRRKRH
ncbi:MAG: hypothetical protein EBZ50_12375, partial [Alphaproteobacteria bacterium]|nr:hypothetical protein [Alphaproteobacteria bacterium]